MLEAPQFITVKEAARTLRVTANTIYIALRNGNGPPHINAGGVIRIPFDDFQKWLKNGGTKSPISRGAPGRRDPRKNSRNKRKTPCTA
jgi:excisionase family DNA binding protein